MDSIYQILSWAFSGTTLLGLVGSIAYYKQNRRLKEAEVKEREAAVEKGRLEGRKIEIEMLNTQLERAENTIKEKQDKIECLEAQIDGHIQRRHELVDKLYASEQETNHVNRQLNEAKDEIIRLTDKSDKLEALKCLRADCRDPRGPKPPRKNQGAAEQH